MGETEKLEDPGYNCQHKYPAEVKKELGMNGFKRKIAVLAEGQPLRERKRETGRVVKPTSPRRRNDETAAGHRRPRLIISIRVTESLNLNLRVIFLLTFFEQTLLTGRAADPRFIGRSSCLQPSTTT